VRQDWADGRRLAQALGLANGMSLALNPVTPDYAEAIPMALSKAVPKRRAEFAAGRRAARAALLAGGWPVDKNDPDAAKPAALLHGCAGQGKTELDRLGRDGAALDDKGQIATLGIGADGLPMWPRGVLGSISHCRDLAGALVGPSACLQLLGLDIEEILTPDQALEIAPMVMPEAQPMASDAAMALNVTRVFSAKEALFKALFPHIRQIKEFSAARALWQGSNLSLVLTEDWGDYGRNQTFAVHQDCGPAHVITAIWR